MSSKTVIVKDNPNPLSTREISFEERKELLQYEEEQEKRENRHSIFKEWTQLNLDDLVIEHLDKLSQNKTAMRLFLFIVKHMDGKNALLASYKVFQEALGLSKASIQRGIKYLSDNNILYIKKSGVANVYLLNPSIAWKSWSSNYKYCEFPASVILAQSEQPDEKDQDQAKIHDKHIKAVELEEQDPNPDL